MGLPTISIHTLHTEGDQDHFAKPRIWREISIHTLHTEGDPLFAFFHPLLEISIHTLHTEGDRRQICGIKGGAT